MTVRKGMRHRDEDALAMANRFGRYKPMEEWAVRKTESQTSRGLEDIMRLWERCVSHSGGAGQMILPDELIGKARMHYTPMDVHDFSLALVGYDNIADFSSKAGAFLNQLIAHCEGTDYPIVTRHLGALISNLTVSKGGKRVIVYGDVGDNAGVRMEGGMLMVDGNVGHGCGSGMSGGAIIVKGDAGRNLGYSMMGGSITVEGSCPGPVGKHMKCGEITVNGMRTQDGVSRLRKRITRFQRLRNVLEWKLRNSWQDFGWCIDKAWQPVSWHLRVWGVFAAVVILAPFAIAANSIIDGVGLLRKKMHKERQE